ncbi:MAG: alpha/beta hydrolase-fold protein [Bryobacteraceae bacterium]|nr:alpha/beta hydrolase-fold protein [Bryobacteraceae bacterium]
MNREHHKWWSRDLHRDMELLVFGHAGTPVLVFPTSMGKYFEYEDRGMVGALWSAIERGHIQLFCVDSVDKESWYNKAAHPYWRVLRHIHYENYILNDVLPLIRNRNWGPLAVTGASFGGYHSINFAFRHPGEVKACVVMGAAFDIRSFLNGYFDDNAYFNNPPDYVGGMGPGWELDRLREMRIVLATGDHDICLGDNRHFSDLLNRKGIPHWLDVWGDGTGHDWPWWQRMARKYFD